MTFIHFMAAVGVASIIYTLYRLLAAWFQWRNRGQAEVVDLNIKCGTAQSSEDGAEQFVIAFDSKEDREKFIEAYVLGVAVQKDWLA